jgi:membrane protease YdiL (CAAX protease family)
MDHEDFTERFGLIPFVLLSCVLSWTMWGLIIASEQGWIPISIPLNPWGSFGPALAALIVILKTDGKLGIRNLLESLFSWRWGFSWWILILGGPFVLVGAAVSILAILESDLSLAPSIPWGQMVILLPVILIVGGPLGEEIGWRGYALPKLLIKYSPITASLIVAGMWMLWHVPLFWIPGATQEGSSIPLFLALVVAFSILTTWIYLGTRRSLLAAVMFHFSINVSTYFLPLILPAVEALMLFEIVFVIIVWVAALLVMLHLRRGKSLQKVIDSV